MAYTSIGRGRGRGRGRGGTGPPPRTSAPANPVLLEGVDQSEKINVDVAWDYHTYSDAISCRPTDVKGVASFDWIDSKTLRVPGNAPVWKDPSSMPFLIPSDTGDVFVDQQELFCTKLGIHRSSGLFAAIDTMDPNFPYHTIDIISDRNNLKKLFKLLDDKERDKDAFRIDVRLVGNALMLTRVEERNVRTKEEENFPVFRNYGDGFVKEVVRDSPRLKGSGHSRVITYTLGGLKCLIGFKLDACIENAKSTTIAGKSQEQKREETTGTFPPHKFGGLNVIHSGTLVPQSSILEITSKRPPMGHYAMRRILLQLYLSGTPNLYVGLHEGGQFDEINKYDASKVQQLQSKHIPGAEKVCGKIVNVLKSVKKILQGKGEGETFALIASEGKLALYPLKDEPVIPLSDQVVNKFSTKVKGNTKQRELDPPDLGALKISGK